jgi:CheY-like chemotaxis protein
MPGELRVLIVEDHQDAAYSLARVVAFWGHDARVAPDGPSALPLAQRFKPHVALLDLGLPRMDGFELARRLAADSAATLLVAISAYDDAFTKMHAKAVGFAAHFVKPADLQALKELLAERKALIEI